MTAHPLMRAPRRPVVCVWEITRACNLRCAHCENFGGASGKDELSFDEMLRVVESLRTLGCKAADLTGGEPLLHPGWDDLASALGRAGIRTSVITNGLLFDEARLERAIAAGVETAGFSLDGPKAVHDELRRRPRHLLKGKSPFDITVENIKGAVGRIGVVVITQVNRLNLPHLPKMHRLLQTLGVERWQLQLTVPVGRALKYPEPLLISPQQLSALTAFIEDVVRRQEKPYIDTGDNIGYYTRREPYLRKRTTGQGVWLGCQAGIRTVALTYNGKVRGCSVLPPEFDAGDLHEESLETIWRDASRFAFSTAFDPMKLEGDCRHCRYGALCRAGCTSMAYYTTGTIYSNPFCISRPGISSEDARGCRAI
jgi:radical SAM protein with 4Fe4S-binding SPASM domain